MTVVERPALRIIDQATWEKAQARFIELKAIYGMKPDGRRRGPAVHYRRLYDRSLLGGKVTCAYCGSKLLVAAHLGEKRLVCPRHRLGECSMSVSVPYERAERAMLEALAQVLTSYPGWLKAAAEAARQKLEEFARAIPSELAKAEAELLEVARQLDRLVKAVVDSHMSGPTVRAKEAALEARKSELQSRIAELQRTRSASMQMPDDAWIGEQLQKLSELLHEEMATVAPQLRPLVGQVVAEQVRAKGMKLGHARLRFTINGWGAIVKILGSKLPAEVLSKITAEAGGTGGDFTVELGRATCVTQWSPLIAEWREQGMTRPDIARRTGLKLGTAWYALKAWKKRVSE